MPRFGAGRPKPGQKLTLVRLAFKTLDDANQQLDAGRCVMAWDHRELESSHRR